MIDDDTLRDLASRLSVAEIAADVGLSQRRVRTRLGQLGIRAQPGMRAPLADVDVAGELRELGSVEAVAARYRVSRQAVYWRLSRLGGGEGR